MKKYKTPGIPVNPYAVWIPTGIGMGATLGASNGNMMAWVAIGAGFGLIVAAMIAWSSRRNFPPKKGRRQKGRE